jgi:hypothetical protein
VMGITRRIDTAVDRDNLMYSRVKAYAETYATVIVPVMYLDTDMLVQDNIIVRDLLQGKDATFCRRSFDRDAQFNIEQRGIKFPEYEGKTLDQLYPYVGCAVVAKSNQVWKDLLAIYEGLDEKFKRWYGDQEALRIYAEKYPERVSEIDEAVYGSLPERKVEDAVILHFKGEGRKKLFEVA